MVVDLDTLTSPRSVDHLKCTLCNHYLSHKPIYMTCSGENICGRCRINTNNNAITRNVAFETLSRNISFPCRYSQEGCTHKMTPKHVPHHERHCPFKIIKCPTLLCDWKGSLLTVIQHCQDTHPDDFLDGEFTVDLTLSQEWENLICHDGKLYVFLRKFDVSAKILQCAVYHIEDEIDVENHNYQLVLKNGKRMLSDEGSTTTFEEKEYMIMALDSLKCDNINEIKGRIVIGKLIHDFDYIEERINEQILSLLKCEGCACYVFPPIYHCKDKIYYFSCKKKDYCENHNMDNIANMLNYPCENKAKGCSVVLKGDEMEEHQMNCIYTKHDCPLHCSWTGTVKDLSIHLQEEHKESLIENCSEIERDTTPGDKIYVIKYANRLFKLLIHSPEYRGFTCAVQKIHDFDGEKFWFEIEIVDKNNNGGRLLGRYLCDVLTEENEATQYDECYCCFKTEQFKRLIVDDRVTFKVCISQ